MTARIVVTAGLVAITIAVTGCSKPAEKPAEKPAAAQAGSDFEKVDSSLISQVKYDAATQELTIEMTSGGDYVYTAVPQDIYKAFMSAPSKGQFYNTNIKGKFKSKE